MSANAILDAALVLADKAWPVFPCHPETKQPLTPKSTPGKKDGGLYRASTDPHVIRLWFASTPKAMIGLPTGKKLGAFVIDLDPKGEDTPADLLRALEERLGCKLPPCPIVKTPRGGWHLYFKMPPDDDIGNRANLLGAKKDESMIDIRGTGGYVITAPSVRSDGVAYAWLEDDAVEAFAPPDAPPQLIDMLLRRGAFGPATTRPAPRPATATDRQSSYVAKALNDEVATAANAPDGQRNDALNIAAFKLGQLVGAGVLQEAVVVAALETVARAWPNFKKSQGTIQSGLQSGKREPRDLSEVGRPAPRSAGKSSGAQPRSGAATPPQGGKKKARPRAGTASPDDERVLIRVIAGRHPEAADEAEAALIAAGAGPIFQRGGDLVHIAERPVRRSDGSADIQEAIVTANEAVLGGQLARVCQFERFDGRAKDFVDIDPPKRVIEDLASRGRWGLPDLKHLIATPTLRADGTLLDREGYDPLTALYLTRALPGLTVPEKPTRLDAERANAALMEIYRDFPFAAGGPHGSVALSTSVALAALLTAFVRSIVAHAPMFAISAPTAGSGKSYLTDVTAVIATGRTAVTMGVGRKPEEFEKALGATLLEGRPIVSIDNVSIPLDSDLLCRVLTQPRVAIRILQFSKIVELSTSLTLFATGNNLAVVGDLARRTLFCHLDSGLENPETREFASDLIEEAERRRAELVSAALTILRWRMGELRGSAPVMGRTLAGFDDWRRLVAGALVALGHADPVAAIDVAKDGDEARQRQAHLMRAWLAAFGEERLSAADAIRRLDDTLLAAAERQDLRDAMSAVARGRGGDLDQTRLGKYLSRIQGKPIGGGRLVKDTVTGGSALWRMDRIKA